MPQYVVADNVSGAVCVVVEAASPVGACRLYDLRLGLRSRVYEEHDPRSRSANATVQAYAVYETTAAFRGTPGGQGAVAERVAGLVKVAVVVVRDG